MPKHVRPLDVRIKEVKEHLERLELQAKIRELRDRVKLRQKRRRR